MIATQILVNPADRCRAVFVLADVANELTLETLHGSEEASRNNIAMNLGKPNFDLINPVGVGRGIVDPNVGVSLKELKKFLRLIRTRVVDNDVDLATWRLTHHDLCKEIDELRACVACVRRSKHLFRLSIQSAVERKGTPGAAGRNWETRVREIKRLDDTLFVNAECSSVRRASNVQSDDVGSFLFKSLNSGSLLRWHYQLKPLFCRQPHY